MKTRDLVRARIAGDQERFMREAVFHGRLLSDGKGRFVTGDFEDCEGEVRNPAFAEAAKMGRPAIP
jgi:hypothetical protein